MTHEDLPIESTRCPITGARRGFKRVFAAQVSTKGHKVAVVLDKIVTDPLNHAAAVKDEAKAAERRLTEGQTQLYETGSPQQREALAGATGGRPLRWGAPAGVNAQALLNSIPADARLSSQRDTWPHIRRRVVPTRALN
jgi:hypothetical protein